MIDPLAPQPMTPEQVRDLVRRTRAAMSLARSCAGAAGTAGLAAIVAARQPSRSRQAAQYARDHGVTLTAAARVFGLRVSSVCEAWWRIYDRPNRCPL